MTRLWPGGSSEHQRCMNVPLIVGYFARMAEVEEGRGAALRRDEYPSNNQRLIVVRHSVCLAPPSDLGTANLGRFRTSRRSRRALLIRPLVAREHVVQGFGLVRVVFIATLEFWITLWVREIV